MDELLPCPFCGGEAKKSYGEKSFIISCDGCHCQTEDQYYNANETECTELWNSRFNSGQRGLRKEIKMKTWTVDEMMAEIPCLDYTQEKLTKLWAGRERLNLIQIFALNIPSNDKMWCVFRKGALSDTQLSELTHVIVSRAVTNYALNHPATASWAKKWLSGEDISESAAESAARGVASAAAWGAASTAAGAAASAAAWGAASTAAARAAESDQQVNDVIAIIAGSSPASGDLEGC